MIGSMDANANPDAEEKTQRELAAKMPADYARRFLGLTHPERAALILHGQGALTEGELARRIQYGRGLVEDHGRPGSGPGCGGGTRLTHLGYSLASEVARAMG